MKKRILMPHQYTALNMLAQRDHAGLFMEMRLGKTLTALRWLSLKQCQRVLIVAPYSALSGWQRECILEGSEPEDIVELFGTKKQRLDCLQKAGKFFLINKEGHRVLPEIASHTWDAIILDESTFVKNPKAKVTKFYINHFRNVKHRLILTGTPAPESPLDYYCQMRFLHHDILMFESYWDFRFKCFTVDNTGHQWTLKEDAHEWLSQRLAHHCYFLTRKKAGIKGKKIYEQRMVMLDRQSKKLYQNLESNFEILDKETKYAPVKFCWLRQLCGGFVDNNFVNNAKVQELESLIYGELKDQPLLVFCQFVHEVIYLHQHFSELKTSIIYGGVSVDERTKRIADFQSAKIDILFIQPETVKYGVDLSRSDTVIYYSSPLGFETRSQSEDRAVNVKKSSVLIIDIVTIDTIEEEMQLSMIRKETKQQTINRMVDAIQRRKTHER